MRLREAWGRVWSTITRSHAAYWRGEDLGPEPEPWGELFNLGDRRGSIRIHRVQDCEPPCPFHAPSAHHMAGWPLEWRGDRGIVERLCRHGVGHPDPDNTRFRADHGFPAVDVHGCDGCCRSR